MGTRRDSPRSRRGGVGIAALGLLVACSGGGDPVATDPTTGATDRSPPATTTAPATTAAPADPAIVDGVANGLVLVHDRDGGGDALVAYRADGDPITRFTEAAGEEEVIWQPIWSPDGRRVAWTRSLDGLAWELVTADVDGGARTTHELPGRPDYIAYDPTGSRVVALTPSTVGFGLVVVDVADDADDAPFTVVDVGRPYFSDFSPAGDRVVAHVGSELRIVGLDGTSTPLPFDSASHQTPAWHPSAEVLFVTADDPTGSRLVAHDLGTDATTDLTHLAAFVVFDVDPTGTVLAVSAFGSADGDDDGLLAFRESPRRGATDPIDGGLWLVDATDGSTTRLSIEPTVAPAWDPTGARVLVRTAPRRGGSWVVYGPDGREAATDEFDVEASLLPAYLPFWDQYVRTQTVWSPDGRRFVHVGRATSGETGVWIHDAATTGPSSFLAPGDLAWWSPT